MVLQPLSDLGHRHYQRARLRRDRGVLSDKRGAHRDPPNRPMGGGRGGEPVGQNVLQLQSLQLGVGHTGWNHHVSVVVAA